MDQDLGALEEPALLWVGSKPTPSYVEYIRQGKQFALLDLQGANMSCALENLPAKCSDHLGVGSVCGQLAISAHARAQCLLGFWGQPWMCFCSTILRGRSCQTAWSGI